MRTRTLHPAVKPDPEMLPGRNEGSGVSWPALTLIWFVILILGFAAMVGGWFRFRWSRCRGCRLPTQFAHSGLCPKCYRKWRQALERDPKFIVL